MQASETGVAAVERALLLLDAFTHERSRLTLHELAEHTGLYKSTILRLLASLMRRECIVRLEDGSYAPGPVLLRWGSAYLSSVRVDTHITPVLAQLVQQTGESATFYVRQQDVRVCLARVDSAHSVRDHVHVGDVLPLDRGAGGKVLLAFEADGGARRARAASSMVFSSFRERDADGAAIAAPVFGPGGTLKGAISLSGSVARFSDAALPRYSRALLTAAAEATRRMGGDASVFEENSARAARSTTRRKALVGD